MVQRLVKTIETRRAFEFMEIYSRGEGGGAEVFTHSEISDLGF
jgi:hypothetical protein